MSRFGRPAAFWARVLTVVGTITIGCSTRTTTPERAEALDCDCAPRSELTSCSRRKGVLPADEVLKRGKALTGKHVSMRGKIVREWSDEDGADQRAPRCDRDATLHVLAFKIGDDKFAKNVERNDTGTLEHVPMCEYAILLDPQRFTCKPEACCPVETYAEVIASGTLTQHECGYALQEPTLCTAVE